MEALVDASLPTKESRQRAIEKLELLSQRAGVLTLDDHLILAKLYWSAGDRSKARDQLRTLATQGRSPEYTLAYAEILLEEKEFSEAENWVRRVEELAPSEFGTAMIRARLLARRSVTTKPTSVWASSSTAIPAIRGCGTLRRRLASARFEEFGNDLAHRGRKEEAEKFFARAETWLPDVGGDADRPTLLRVLFLIRRERSNDAVAEIERMQQGKDLDTLAKACLAIAQVNTNEHDVLERATRVAEHLVSVKPSADSWIALGALQDRMASYDAAEHSYREGLAVASARIDALNNLAYILALRKKELPEARKLIDQALANGGPRGPLEDSLAMIELAMGNTDEALSDANRACSDDPNPVHLFHLARLQMTKGDRNAAKETFQNARKGGLTPASLHPLERPTLTELETQLDHAAH